ncbi:hypothetical protein Mlaev_02740 [Microbacterium laevaniformans]|uniref:Uncharacterized protein n=1 Tax=Microbacterium laevaniformans TaxID=36807 RepID=A0A150H679_9MICO|nr:hypothetical protein Mlaev_02740 [Microbacterium laevaniformans]
MRGRVEPLGEQARGGAQPARALASRVIERRRLVRAARRLIVDVGSRIDDRVEVRPFDLALAERIDRCAEPPERHHRVIHPRLDRAVGSADGRGELGGDLAHRQIASLRAS